MSSPQTPPTYAVHQLRRLGPYARPYHLCTHTHIYTHTDHVMHGQIRNGARQARSTLLGLLVYLPRRRRTWSRSTMQGLLVNTSLCVCVCVCGRGHIPCITMRGSTTLPRLLLILLPFSSNTNPCVRTCDTHTDTHTHTHTHTHRHIQAAPRHAAR